MPTEEKFRTKRSNQYPQVSNQQPQVSNQYPQVSDQVPQVSNQQPQVSNQQTQVSNQQPQVSNQVPQVSNQGDDTNPPASTTSAPTLPEDTTTLAPTWPEDTTTPGPRENWSPATWSQCPKEDENGESWCDVNQIVALSRERMMWNIRKLSGADHDAAVADFNALVDYWKIYRKMCPSTDLVNNCGTACAVDKDEGYDMSFIANSMGDMYFAMGGHNGGPQCAPANSYNPLYKQHSASFSKGGGGVFGLGA